MHRVVLQGFTGTIFLPSNAAVDTAVAALLQLVSNVTGTKVAALPTGLHPLPHCQAR